MLRNNKEETENPYNRVGTLITLIMKNNLKNFKLSKTSLKSVLGGDHTQLNTLDPGGDTPGTFYKTMKDGAEFKDYVD